MRVDPKTRDPAELLLFLNQQPVLVVGDRLDGYRQAFIVPPPPRHGRELPLSSRPRQRGRAPRPSASSTAR
jgi:hypothetical protein